MSCFSWIWYLAVKCLSSVLADDTFFLYGLRSLAAFIFLVPLLRLQAAMWKLQATPILCNLYTNYFCKLSLSSCQLANASIQNSLDISELFRKSITLLCSCKEQHKAASNRMTEKDLQIINYCSSKLETRELNNVVTTKS